jgi:hypothetical protein
MTLFSWWNLSLTHTPSPGLLVLLVFLEWIGRRLALGVNVKLPVTAKEGATQQNREGAPFAFFREYSEDINVWWVLCMYVESFVSCISARLCLLGCVGGNQ